MNFGRNSDLPSFLQTFRCGKMVPQLRLQGKYIFYRFANVLEKAKKYGHGVFVNEERKYNDSRHARELAEMAKANKWRKVLIGMFGYDSIWCKCRAIMELNYKMPDFSEGDGRWLCANIPSGKVQQRVRRRST